jgi:hypothetical protein
MFGAMAEGAPPSGDGGRLGEAGAAATLRYDPTARPHRANAPRRPDSCDYRGCNHNARLFQLLPCLG